MNLISELLYILNRRERLKAMGVLFLMLIGAGFEALGIGLIMFFVGLISNPGYVLEHDILRRVYYALGMASPQKFMIWFGICLIILYLLKNVYLLFLYYVQYKFVYNKQVSLAGRLLEVYLRSPYTFHLYHNTAEMLNNINSRVLEVFQGVLTPLSMLLIEVMIVIMVSTLLVTLMPALTIVVILIGGVIVYIFSRGMHKKIEKWGERQQLHLQQMIKWVNQGLGGIKETKILDRESFFLDSYTKESICYARSLTIFYTVKESTRPFIETIAVVGILLSAIIIVIQAQNIQPLLPILALFIMVVIRFIPSVNRIINSITCIRYYKPSLDVICHDLALIKDKKFAVLATKGKQVKNSNPIVFSQSIELKKVSYQYPGTKFLTIKEISLTISKGESIAFVGPSGGGKTTLVDVILGLLEPTRGEVLVDGRNIHDNLASWHKNIGYIPQMTYLLDDTIARNIAYSLPEEMIDYERVWSAVRAAQLEDFINSLPQKLNTVVGERGVRISGGQRQRIGIARTLYHAPKVIVMDEATSSLEYEIEQEIIKAIDYLSKDTTLIIVAHRITTVRNCNILFFIKNGQLVDTAPYEALFQTNGDFRKLIL